MPHAAQYTPRGMSLDSVNHTIRRRELLAAAGIAGLGVLLGSCSADGPESSNAPSGATTRVASSFPPLGDRRDLRLRLWAEPGQASIIAGKQSEVWRFGAEVLEGDPASVVAHQSYLGPTLRFHRGQRVRVRFENRLREPTIVHWHGLVLPQLQDGQPNEAVPGGATYDYDFVVDNEPGTYWYHAHPHGRTGEQVYRGLAGVLIVYGDEPDLPKDERDIPVVLQDRTLGADGQLRYVRQMHDQMAGFVAQTLVADGVAECTIPVARAPFRLRLLNAANARTQLLRWSDRSPMHVVATDGHLLPSLVTVPAAVVTPGQRADVWMDFSRFEPGARVELQSANLFVESPAFAGGGMGGMGGMGANASLNLDWEVAVTFVVQPGAASPGKAPSIAPARPLLTESTAVNRSQPKVFELTMRQASHWINGVQWADRSVAEVETAVAGTVELWEFVNRSPLPHPMHLHGQPIRVVSRTWDDRTLANEWSSIEEGLLEEGLRDTVLVWPGQRVRIVVPFGPHEGYFLYHCHVLEHEDAGMMRSFRVLPAGGGR